MALRSLAMGRATIETVMDDVATLPPLLSMSEVAGRMLILISAHRLGNEVGGSGMSLGAGRWAVDVARVVLIGAASWRASVTRRIPYSSEDLTMDPITHFTLAEKALDTVTKGGANTEAAAARARSGGGSIAACFLFLPLRGDLFTLL